MANVAMKLSPVSQWKIMVWLDNGWLQKNNLTDEHQYSMKKKPQVQRRDTWGKSVITMTYLEQGTKITLDLYTCQHVKKIKTPTIVTG